MEDGEIDERTTASNANSIDRSTQSINTKPSIVQQEFPELVLEGGEVIERTTTSNVDSIESTTQSKVKIKNQFVKVVENGDTNNILRDNINDDDDDVENSIDDNDISAMYDDDDLSYDDTGDEN